VDSVPSGHLGLVYLIETVQRGDQQSRGYECETALFGDRHNLGRATLLLGTGKTAIVMGNGQLLS